MSHHLERQYVECISKGLQEGLRVGFDYKQAQYRREKCSMVSAKENQTVVDQYLANERGLGRVVSPITGDIGRRLQVNRFGVIPKNNQPGKWRLIVDLSHPEGSSVNVGIDPTVCSLDHLCVHR